MLTGPAPHLGSRDRTVRLWCVGEESGRPNTEPMVTQHEKARSVAICACAEYAAAHLQIIMELYGTGVVAVLQSCAALSLCTCDPEMRIAMHSMLRVMHTLPPQRDKVRDVQYNQSLGRVASLVTNGSVQLWDPHLRLAGTVRGL